MSYWSRDGIDIIVKASLCAPAHSGLHGCVGSLSLKSLSESGALACHRALIFALRLNLNIFHFMLYLNSVVGHFNEAIRTRHGHNQQKVSAS
jgi:hypothetical protein